MYKRAVGEPKRRLKLNTATEPALLYVSRLVPSRALSLLAYIVNVGMAAVVVAPVLVCSVVVCSVVVCSVVVCSVVVCSGVVGSVVVDSASKEEVADISNNVEETTSRDEDAEVSTEDSDTTDVADTSVVDDTADGSVVDDTAAVVDAVSEETIEISSDVVVTETKHTVSKLRRRL